jgi:hypothetical protein
MAHRALQRHSLGCNEFQAVDLKQEIYQESKRV